MPRIRGFFESSILSGTRFTKIENYIKNELIFKNEDDLIEPATEFVKEQMNYILYGKDEYLYKFKQLFKITAKRKRKINNKMIEKEYKYYALKINNEILKEQLFSTGEYFLLQLLKFLDKFTNEKNIVPPLVIIDEIEISLHPLAQERLIKNLNKLCNEYNIIVIFASHSLHVIDNIECKKRYYIERSFDDKINIENPVDIGYLTTKLYKHQFYDFILLVEDIMAQEYVRLTMQEINNKHFKCDVIPVGPCDRVMEMARINFDKKYFGEAKVLPIIDEDKKDLLSEYRYSSLGGTYIPVPKFIESFIYPIFADNDTVLRKKFSNFISKIYPPNDLDSLRYIWDKNQDEKNTCEDISYKIAEKQKPKSPEQLDLMAGDVMLKLVSFVYEEFKNTQEHEKFINRLKKFFKLS